MAAMVDSREGRSISWVSVPSIIPPPPALGCSGYRASSNSSSSASESNLSTHIVLGCLGQQVLQLKMNRHVRK